MTVAAYIRVSIRRQNDDGQRAEPRTLSPSSDPGHCAMALLYSTSSSFEG